MIAQRAYSSPPTPNRGSTRWRIAARQISTTRILSRFASRPSRTNLSMTQNKTAPTTTMISTLIRTKSMVFPLLARGVRIYIVAACRPGPEDNRACCGVCAEAVVKKKPGPDHRVGRYAAAWNDGLNGPNPYRSAITLDFGRNGRRIPSVRYAKAFGLHIFTAFFRLFGQGVLL
jgi:hypothetical protein